MEIRRHAGAAGSGSDSGHAASLVTLLAPYAGNPLRRVSLMFEVGDVSHAAYRSQPAHALLLTTVIDVVRLRTDLPRL